MFVRVQEGKKSVVDGLTNAHSAVRQCQTMAYLPVDPSLINMHRPLQN